MKIVITGGHFSPAYSVIQKIKHSNEILVIGRKHAFEGDKSTTFEFEICRSNNIPFEVLSAGRLQRKFTSQTVMSFLKFPKGVYKALSILRKNKPDVVVTFGGYVGLPVALAAKILNVPVVLHEQTLRAGLSARLISKIASIVLISFESSRQYFHNKEIVLTGNPIRPEFFEEPKNNLKIHKPMIYITGGSTGSHFINEIIGQIVPRLIGSYQVYHQTGNSEVHKDFEKLSQLQGSNYIVSKFFTPIETFALMRRSDLVISRAGINTITELIATGTVALLIPLLHGQKNEQLDNSEHFKKLGMGDYILQNEITPHKLLNKISAMIKEQEKYKKNGLLAQKTVKFEAVDKIVEQIYFYGKREERRKSNPPLWKKSSSF